MRKAVKFLVVLLSLAFIASVSAFAVACNGDNGSSEPKDNAVTVLTIENWTYGEQAKTPVATSTYGTAVFTYSSSEDGEYTETVPTGAGVYFLKATVTATSEYKGAEKIISFTINKADNLISGFNSIDGITCHGTPTLSATAVYGNIVYTFSTAEDGEYGAEPSHFVAGVYFVKATSESNENYNAQSVIKSFTVTHSEAEQVEAAYLKSEADCCHYAEYYKSCAECGAKLDGTFEYADGGFGTHKSIIAVEEEPATCHSIGHTAGEYCEDCKEYVSGHEVINMTAHDWVADAVNSKAPTCTENGINAYKCANDGCNATKTEVGEPATGHSVTTWTKTGETKVPGTDRCEYQITYTGTCENCGATITKTEMAEKHNFYYAITTEPTCQHEGVKTEYCMDEDCIYHNAAHATAAYPLPANADGHDWAETADSGVWECNHCHITKTVISEDSDRIENVSADQVSNDTEIQLTTAAVKLDQGVIDQLGETVSISAEEKDKSTINTDGLSEEEKAQFNNAKAVYDFTLTTNGGSLSEFGENNYITIKIPYVLQAGDNPDKIVVWCVKDDGSLESFDASYANGFVTFRTNHFSIYTVVEMTAEEYCAKHNCHSHEYISANPDKFLVVAPTCTLGGYTVCLNCGEVIFETPATGHKWHGETITSVSCLENGHDHYECSVCGVSYETYSPAMGHHYVISAQKAATCTERGSVTYECTHCHDSYTVYIAKLEHKYVVETVSATCTTDGYTKKTCHLCGAETITDYVPASGHIYGNEWIKTADGHYHICINCGEADDMHDHIAGAEATETTAQICTECGYILSAPLGHECKNHLTEVDEKSADCTNDGNIRYYVCDCGKWYLDENAEQLIEDHLTVYTDALGHDAEQYAAIEPSCEEVGYTAGIWCNRCQKWVKGHIEIPATGHTYTATVIKPTCIAGGKTVYTCECGDTYEGNFTDALGHNYIATVHAPDCTHGGYTEHICSVCGDSYIDGETDALGHKISVVWSKDGESHWHVCGRCEEISDKADHIPDYEEATETHGIHCSVCGYQLAEMLEHVHKGVKRDRVEPTCTAGGTMEYYVCACGDYFFDEDCNEKVTDRSELMLAPIGHEYGEPTYAWSEDNTTCTATRICTHNGSHIETETVKVVSVITQERSCEKDELTTYTARFNNSAFEVQIKENIKTADAYGHEYGEPTYVWSDDNTTCTATRVCGRDRTHIETETVTVVATVTQEQSCEKDELTTYTATFENDAFAVQTKENIKTAEAYGHEYGEPTYVWSDDNATCTATRVCVNDGSHIETETVRVTARVVQERSCTADELTTYIASFRNVAFAVQTKANIKTADAYGHSDSAWQYDENGHYRICQKCGERYDEEAHIPDYEEATTEHGITCTVCGYEIEPKKEDENKPAYSLTATATMGDGTVVVFNAEFYGDSSAVMSRTINGRTETENSTWRIIDGKIVVEVDDMYLTFVIKADDTIEPYIISDAEVAYRVVVEGNYCTLYRGGSYGYRIGDLQFTNDWYEEDGIVYILYHGEGYRFTLRTDGTLVPYEEQQEKEVKFRYVTSYSDGPMGNTVVTYTFYNDNTYETTTVSGGEQIYHEENNWQVDDGKITLYADGMYYSFIFEGETAIRPYLKQEEVLYTANLYNYLDCSFYSDGVWAFMMGDIQFYNDYTEKDGKISIIFNNETLTFVVDKDGRTLVPYEEQQGTEVVYTYSTVFAELGNTQVNIDFNSDFSLSGGFVVNGGVQGFGGSWEYYNENKNVRSTIYGLHFDFVVSDGRLTPYAHSVEGNPVYTTVYNGVTINFYGSEYYFTTGRCQFYSDYKLDGDIIEIVFIGENVEFKVNADGTLTPQEGHGEDPQGEVLYRYNDVFTELGYTEVFLEFMSDFKLNGELKVNGESQWFESVWEYYNEDKNIRCYVFGLCFDFTVGEDKLNPYIYRVEGEPAYTTYYNGVTINFYNGVYYFNAGHCQFYSDYRVEDGVIEIVFIGYNVSFTVNADGTLTPIEGHGEDPQEKLPVYNYVDRYSDADGKKTAYYTLYDDNSFEVTFESRDGSNTYYGVWNESADQTGLYVTCIVNNICVIFSIENGTFLPFIERDFSTSPVYYSTQYNGRTIQFVSDTYYFMEGNCQWYGNYKVEDGRINIFTFDGYVSFKMSDDGTTLVPVNDDPQGKEPLYIYETTQVQQGYTIRFVYYFYSENNELSIIIDMTEMGGSQSVMGGGSWYYDDEGRIVAEADYNMGGIFTVNPDGKTLAPYEEEIEAEVVYTSAYQGLPMEFYDNGVFTINMGGQIMKGTWSVVISGVVGADVGGEVLYLSINDDGSTLTPIMDETTIFTFRVVAVNDKGEYVATAEIVFDYYDPQEYPDMYYQYESHTTITLREGATIKIEKSLDGVNYTVAASAQYETAGDYEVIYKKNDKGGSSYSCIDLSEYQMPFVGSVTLEDGKYYFTGKDGSETELPFTEDDGVYHFDLSVISQTQGIGWDNLYFTLNGRMFEAYIPETEALYNLDRDWCKIKLYDDGYLVFEESRTKYCTAYEMLLDGEGDTYLSVSGERLENILGRNPYVLKNGTTVDGWQEGDIQDEIRVIGFSCECDYYFIVGQGNMKNLQFRVDYSDGNCEYLDAQQIEIKGRVDFNVAGTYTVIATYYVDETNSFQTSVTIMVGNPDDIRDRYIDGNGATWIINERGVVEPDLSNVCLVEYTFAGVYTRRPITVRELNQEDYSAALRGTSKSTYTIRTVYTYLYDTSQNISFTVTTITEADLIECYEYTEVRGDLYYYLDKGEFVTGPGMGSAVMTVYYRITFDEGDGQSDMSCSLVVPFTMDLFDLEGNDFTAQAGVYQVPIGNGITDFAGTVKVISFLAEDLEIMVMIGNMRTQEYANLPDAYVGESAEEYADRLCGFIGSEDIVIMYAHMANNAGLDSQMLNTIEKDQLNFSKFDTSAKGKTTVIINIENFLGIQDAIEITINVIE